MAEPESYLELKADVLQFLQSQSVEGRIRAMVLDLVNQALRTRPILLSNQEKEALTPLLLQADGIILSALVPGELAPILITDEMVRSMKPGAAIIDVSIDQGGNCEVTEPGKEVFKHDVYICGMQNIPGRMPIHSTWLYANNMYHYVENLFKKGRDKPDMDDEIVSASLVTYQGKIFFKGALKAMGETG